MKLRTEVIVVGGGIAGMAFAHRLVNAAEPGTVRVRLLLKAPMTSSSSQLAQGGLAAALHATDSVEAHVQDTLRTGGGRNNEAVVRAVVAEGPRVVEELLALGAELDRDAAGKLRLAREGGHGRARVVHHADRTGAEIVRVLDAHTRAHPAIERVEGMRALDLLEEEEGGAPRCTGVQVLRLEDGMLCELRAHLVVLATGGEVDMVIRTTRAVTFTSQVAHDRSEVGMGTLTHGLHQPGRPVLGAEDNVDDDVAERLGHCRKVDVGKLAGMWRCLVGYAVGPSALLMRTLERLGPWRCHGPRMRSGLQPSFVHLLF